MNHKKWIWKSNSSGSIISNTTTTFVRKLYIVLNHNPSILPYGADVIMKRDIPRLLSILAEQIEVHSAHCDIYDKFFGKHTLPKKVEKKIAWLLKKERLLYGSDASVNNKFCGSFAWGIIDRTNKNYMFIKSHAPLHEDIDQIHSRRGELFGILGCMRHLDYIISKYKLKLQHKVSIYTDSQSSIKIAKTPAYISYKEIFCSDTGIKFEVRSLYKKLHSFINLHYIKAHQDDKIDFN